MVEWLDLRYLEVFGFPLLVEEQRRKTFLVQVKGLVVVLLRKNL